MARILIVEDEKYLAESVQDWLVMDGHQVDVSLDSRHAEAVLAAKDYDVIILDVLLPGIDGVELCRRYRTIGGVARILIVSGKGTSADKEAGLDAGADDYISKPISLPELGARIRALMRRSVSILGNKIVAGELILDLERHEAKRGDYVIKLLPQEFVILEFLMKQPNKIFSAEALIKKLWQGNASIDTLRTHIKTIRKKIDRPGLSSMIQTVHGVGYALNVEAGQQPNSKADE